MNIDDEMVKVGDAIIRALLTAIAVLCVCLASLAFCETCGTERWPVKTLADADAARVAMEPVYLKKTSISKLNGIPVPPKVADAAPRGLGLVEFLVFEVQGVAKCVKVEQDSDIHICLQDGSAKMIAESPDPKCVGEKNPFLHKLIFARLELLSLVTPHMPAKDALKHLKSLIGRRLVVRGVGFIDKKHGQEGMAPNAIELHPILSIAEAK